MTVDVRPPTEAEKQLSQSWPIWSKEPSQFDWSYDEQETCLILEGAAMVTTAEGQTVHIHAGDWVVFPRGLQCTWQVTQPLKKRYQFN